WPDAVAAEASALALEIALAHEAVSHAHADAAAAGMDEALRDAPITIVTGAAASFTRAAHTALVVIDGLAPPRPTTLYRDPDHALPLGVSSRPELGASVRAGDTLATGSLLGSPVRVDGARRLGVEAADVDRVMRVAVGADVARGTVLARTGRRFARAATAPMD